MKSITAVAIAGLCLVMMTLPSQLYALPSRYAYSSEMEQKYDTDELDMAIMEALAHMSESDAETEEGDYDDYEDDMPLEIQTIANNMQRLPETRREVTVKNCKWYGDLIGNAIGFTLHNALPAKFRDAYTVYIDCKAPRTKCTRVRVGYHRFSGTASGLDIAADVEVCKKPGSRNACVKVNTQSCDPGPSSYPLPIRFPVKGVRGLVEIVFNWSITKAKCVQLDVNVPACRAELE